MPKVGDHCTGTEILLPRGDKMARGHAVAQSHNVSGTIIGRAHTNPIIDTRMYQVEFAVGKVTELAANIIAESIYAQCDAGRNQYLLLDNKAISLTDQQTSI